MRRLLTDLWHCEKPCIETLSIRCRASEIICGYDMERKKLNPERPVEFLFPFVLRSRILMVGRSTLARNKSALNFVLITGDISENSRKEILQDFRHYPIVQHYTSGELERHFGIKGCKVVGFRKSDLARSLYAGLKTFRINRPPSESEKNT